MKKQLLITILMGCVFVLNAQHSPTSIGFPQAIPLNSKLKFKPQQKAYADTLYYQDFDSTGTGGLPMGWMSTDFTNNGFDWIWSDSAPGGQFSTAVGPLQSNTATNGYLLLPSDRYNTGLTGGPIAMDAQVTSPAISLNAKPYVNLEFDYYYRYCCGISVSLLVVEVSADSVNWTAFDITKGRSQSAVTPNAEHFKVDVSAVLANQTKAYIRFKQRGASYYFYMVDDVMLTEGAAADLVMTYAEMTFPTGRRIEPKYTIIPSNDIREIEFEFKGKNLSTFPRTNVNGKLVAYHDSTYFGSPGLGLLFNRFDLKNLTLQPNTFSDTFSIEINTYLWGIDGYYNFNLSIESDSNQINPPQIEKNYYLAMSDTVLAKDRNQFASQINTRDFVNGGKNGDQLLSLMGPGCAYGFVTTVSYYIPNDTSLIGVGIQPRIYEYNDSLSSIDSSIGILVGSSPFSGFINQNTLGSWIDLPLFPPVYLLPNKLYAAGLEQMSTTNPNRSIGLGVDLSVQENVVPVTNLVYVDSTWQWVNVMFGIRLNFDPSRFYGCSLVGLTNSLLNQPSIYPNPSKGQLTLELSNAIEHNGQIQVRNIQGQVVHEQNIQAQKSTINLEDLPSGIYLMSIQNGQERLSRKLIIE